MLYIITAVHNRIKTTTEFVRQLKQQTMQDFCLLLVDDGSTDGTAAMVKNELPNAIILAGNGNLWWGGALDKAYHYVKQNHLLKPEDCVYICNDDITIANNFLETGIRLVNENNGFLITAKGINDETGGRIEGATYRDPVTADGHWMADGEPGNCTSTRSLFMSGETYLDIGGMHPILLPHYRSDYEYTIRAARKGHACLSFDELSIMVHTKETGKAKVQGLKQKFSKSYMNNPIYNVTFILLVTPLSKLPAYVWHLIRRK